MVRSRIGRLFMLAGTLSLPLRTVSAHPIHMSYTEMRYTAATQSLELSVRVYANDFSAAAARRAGVRLKADSLIDLRSALSYISGNLAIIGGSNRAIALVPCGVTHSQDMLRFCFRARVDALTGMRIRNSIMTELFTDQVNVVQSVSANGRTSRLFVRGDSWKPAS